MTEIIRLQNQLQQELTRRFERPLAIAFSDIVGSTQYFARFGDAAGRQLQQLHIDLVSACLPKREGRIVDTAGDGALLAFPTTDGAADALIELQQLVSLENANRARDHQLQVRIGLHWGPVLTDGNVVSGDSVNLCSRVAASANIDEIRLTREVFQNLRLQHRLNCRLVGPVELRGASRQIELLSLDWRDHSIFPTMVRIEETGEQFDLPRQDIISFGRLREHDGTLANDVVLAPADPVQARQISRWHFELRRFADGFRVRPVSDGITEVNGEQVTKGHEVPIRPGASIRVAQLLTITLASPPRPAEETSDETSFAGDHSSVRVVVGPGR
ncbi:MAG TPA: adenylate/guanylate cyclase domain-containing protein [Burkholderiales bacterium]|nr:adenylate/guanylate cyclase domain-containing protein [Burkholderiales bacterium]